MSDHECVFNRDQSITLHTMLCCSDHKCYIHGGCSIRVYLLKRMFIDLLTSIIERENHHNDENAFVTGVSSHALSISGKNITNWLL